MKRALLVIVGTGLAAALLGAAWLAYRIRHPLTAVETTLNAELATEGAWTRDRFIAAYGQPTLCGEQQDWGYPSRGFRLKAEGIGCPPQVWVVQEFGPDGKARAATIPYSKGLEAFYPEPETRVATSWMRMSVPRDGDWCTFIVRFSGGRVESTWVVPGHSIELL